MFKINRQFIGISDSTLYYKGFPWEGQRSNLFYIDGYKRNVTICYSNNCVDWKQNSDVKLKIPKICHGPCKCTDSGIDINKCVMFDTSDKICLECNCKIDFHSKTYFNFSSILYHNKNVIDNDKKTATKIITTFYFYKKEIHEEISFENTFHKMLNMQDAKHRAIYDNFKQQLEEEAQNITNAITCEDILMCLKNLYKITTSAGIIPNFIEEILPEDFKLETIGVEESDPNKETEICEADDINKVQLENQTSRNKIAEIQQTLQNANDLNSKLIQDMRTLVVGRKLNLSGENTKEEEMN